MKPTPVLLLALLGFSTVACGGGIDYTPMGPTPVPAPAVSPTPPQTIMAISVGEVVRDTIGITDPICDPSGWDATASCKLFEVVAASDGTLHAILKTVVPQRSDDVIDILFSCPDVPRGYSGRGIEQRLSAPVRAGDKCNITIHFYPNVALKGSMDFELRTEM